MVKLRVPCASLVGVCTPHPPSYTYRLLLLQQLQDMASACDCKVEAVDDSAEMVIMSCMFQEVLTQEGLPQLLRHFCCQHNIMWLDAYKPHGLLASLEKSKAKGDDVCVIKVYKEK